MPSPEVVERALVEMRKRAANYVYFFDHLKSPSWIEPLREKGFFASPPEPKREGDYISFPTWPESRYLARMAALEPQLVLDVMLKVSETKNVRVHEDFADAACAMPPELAAKWAKREIRWVKNQQYLYLLLPFKLADLVSHLASGGRVDVALELARTLFAILPDSRDPLEIDVGGGRTYSPSPEPRARFKPWTYRQIVKEHLSGIVSACGEAAFQMLCDLLEGASRLSLRPKEREGPEDYSYIWRPAIDEQEENLHGGLRDVLISAVRDSGTQLAQDDPKMLPSLVNLLEQRDFLIFRRLALYLLHRFSEAAPDLVAERLTERTLFDAPHLKREYYLLLRDNFGQVKKEHQAEVLSWIGEGPHWKEGAPPERIRRWQCDWLNPIRDCLPEQWRKRYEEMVEEVGLSEHPEFVSYSTGFRVGPTSPQTAEDLRSMTVVGIVSYLRDWQPSGDLMSPSVEGLGRELKTLVASEPERFADEATEFKGLDPTYVRSLLDGLREAVKQKRPFAWSQVLELCDWAIQQPREIPGRSDWEDRDPGWVWTRKTIASLLGSGFQEEDTEIPFALRTQAWKVLKPLTDDPDPTLEYEAEYGGSNMDPYTMSINSVRGEAMHSVIKYALWVRRHPKDETDAEERLGRGFDEMPEVREVLNLHLDPDRDPSQTIRAVYGRWFPWLNLMDSDWAEMNRPRIFPQQESTKPLRDAAWVSYVSFCRPYKDVLHVLRDEYARAVERIGAVSTEIPSWESADEHLASHLMTFYGHGDLTLDTTQGLLSRFFARASDSLRGHAIGFIGRGFCNSEAEIDSDVLERFRTLWEWRMEVASAADSPESHRAELSAFGWWFASGKFDDTWAIEQLHKVLEIVGRVEPDHKVAERLATLAGDMPLLATQCLRLMIEGDKEDWRVHMWKDEARAILSTALGSSDKKAHDLAEDVVHRLGARRFLEFRDLLSAME